MTKVSIITAVYNNVFTIENCIKSVLEQNYRNIEYIIIDGNSTDGTKEIIEKYLSQIAVFISEPDNGIYDALNKGLALATGDITGLLHSDDTFGDKNTIAEIVGLFETHTPDLIYGDLVYVHKDKPEKTLRYWQSTPFNFALLKKGWMPPHPTLFIKNELLQTIGFYNTNYKIAADYDFILRTFSKKNIKTYYLPKIITCMRTGGTSNKGFKNIVRKSAEDYSILKRNKIGGIYSLVYKNLSKIKQFI